MKSEKIVVLEATRGIAAIVVLLNHLLQAFFPRFDGLTFPDERIEYDTPDGVRARVDLELATSHYRGRLLAEKVRAGFSIYAHASDVSNLRRVLDQRELTAEILSL